MAQVQHHLVIMLYKMHNNYQKLISITYEIMTIKQMIFKLYMVQMIYIKMFKICIKRNFLQAQLEYDNKQTRADRKIGDYFNHISKDSKHDLACELIIELGDMDFWNDKTMGYKKQMTEVYKDQIYKLMEVVPDFKVANAVVHYDETSPHMHLVGIPVKDGYKNGMKKQVAKSKIFTKESLKILQDKMRVILY